MVKEVKEKRHPKKDTHTYKKKTKHKKQNKVIGVCGFSSVVEHFAYKQKAFCLVFSSRTHTQKKTK